MGEWYIAHIDGQVDSLLALCMCVCVMVARIKMEVKRLPRHGGVCVGGG